MSTPSVRRFVTSGIAEAVPADLLSHNARPCKRRPDTFVQQTVRTERLGAVELDRRKKEVHFRSEARPQPPIQECIENDRMKGHRAAGRLSPGFSELVAHTGTENFDFHCSDVHVLPGQSYH